MKTAFGERKQNSMALPWMRSNLRCSKVQGSSASSMRNGMNSSVGHWAGISSLSEGRGNEGL